MILICTVNQKKMQVACISLGTLGELRGGVNPEDNEPSWSIKDFINTMKQKPIGDKYGTATWNDMIKGDHQNELVGISYQLVIPGSQGRTTPCANIIGLQTILGLLPGKIAETYRKEARDILNQVITGDKSLIKIIEANGNTATPFQTLLRGAMKRGREPGVIIEDPEDRRIRLRKMEAEITQMNAGSMKILEEGYTRHCIGGIIDDRARLHFKDQYLNIVSGLSGLCGGSQGLITTGEAAQDTRPLTISTYATELKIRMNTAQGIQAGRIMAKLYRDKYGRDASTHEQFVDGANRSVKSYTRVDSDLLEQAIRKAVGL